MKKMSHRRYMRRIGLILTVAFMMNVLPVYAAWDGHKEEEKAAAAEHVILNTDNMGVLLKTGGIPSTAQKKNSRYSLLWDHGSTRIVRMTQDIPRDWGEYERLEFQVYSEKATGGQFAIVVRCDPQTTTGESYFMSSQFVVDWEGWRNFNISLAEEMSINRAAVWNKITTVSAETGAWGMKQIAGTRLYFDKMVLKKTSDNDAAGYSEEFQEDYAKATAGAAIVYGDSSKTLYNGELTALCKDDSSLSGMGKDGILFVPVSYFADYLGCQTEIISKFSPSEGTSDVGAV